MNRKIIKIQAISLILLLSILNGNILPMQKSNLSIIQDVQQGLSKEMLNERLRDILNRFPINRNDLGEAVKLILAGANVNDKNNYRGFTTLMLATRDGHKDIVQLLIGAGANVNVKDIAGNTALMFAAYYGYKDIVQLLIEVGANVNVKDKYGYTALMLAAKHGHADVVQLLIDGDANANDRDNAGNTALTFAVSNGHTGIVGLLEATKNKKNHSN